MSTWQEFAEEAPELAKAVRARFEATKHHVLATLRKDGSPRVSGTEVTFSGPELTLGSMLNARKAADLLRDGRCAIHANPGDGSMEGGDAKVSGVAYEVRDAAAKAELLGGERPPGGDYHLFRVELAEVTLTTVEGALVIKHWRSGVPVRVHRRE